MASSGALEVILRHGCERCDQVLLELDLLGIAYRWLDVDADPALLAAFNALVPVLRKGDRWLSSPFTEAAMVAFLNRTAAQ
jgi:glutathione S-transferase